METLREQVAYLQGVIATRDRELEQRAEEIPRRDAALEREQQLTAIIADRLRELEAPREARESDVSLGPGNNNRRTRSGVRRASTGASLSEDTEHQSSTLKDWSGGVGAGRRPWWRRMSGR